MDGAQALYQYKDLDFTILFYYIKMRIKYVGGLREKIVIKIIRLWNPLELFLVQILAVVANI